MGKTYTAFGLALNSSFPLPATEPAEGEGLPPLALSLETLAEAEAAWSAPLGSSPWRGVLGDGRQLTIEWGSGGDLLFTYEDASGKLARFRLDLAANRLVCAPRDVDCLDWQRVLASRVLPNVSIAYGREALHASSVETPLGVVAIAAQSGTGKSTLACELMRRGHRLFADDVLVLARGATGIDAHPGTPHINLADGAPGLAPEMFGRTLAEFEDERWVAVADVATQARPVAAIILFERRLGAHLAVEPIERTPLVLAPYMLGLPDDDGRDANSFALYSDLVTSARLLRLTAADDEAPTAIAEELERALELAPELAIGGRPQ